MTQSTIHKILGGSDTAMARIVAGFDSPDEARFAKDAIDELLTGALIDVTTLVEHGGGQADSTDVARIFARQGLGENIDWGPQNSPIVSGDELAWDVPRSFELEDAYTLLSAVGAKQVAVQDQVIEPWRDAAYPLGMALVEEDNECDGCEQVEVFRADDSFDSFEPLYSAIIQKRTLH